MTISRVTRSRPRGLAALTFSLVSTTLARAAALQTTDCSVVPQPLNCRLQGVLSFLYVAAAILGVILLVVVVLAVRHYRNSRRGPWAAQ